MGYGLNRAMLLGNLCADPVLRFTQGGTGVLNVRIATNQSFFDKTTNERKERVDFHNVIVWGKLGESLAKIVKKGSKCYVEGPIRTSSFTDQQGNKRYKTEIVATLVRLCGERKGEGQGAPARGRSDAAPPQDDEPPVGFEGHADDEDIPF